jgi:hypothetical protein
VIAIDSLNLEVRPAFLRKEGSRPFLFTGTSRILKCSRRSRPSHRLLAGTARSMQGRADVWRGEAHPCLASTVLALRATFDGRRSGNTFPLVSFQQLGLDSRADDSGGAGATIDHSDIRGSKPHGHDPSGAASD